MSLADIAAVKMLNGLREGQCLGYVKQTALATAVGLSSIPANTVRATVQVEGGDVRWRGDGSNPTATDGMLLPANAERDFAPASLAALKFIQVSSAATLHVTYWGAA